MTRKGEDPTGYISSTDLRGSVSSFRSPKGGDAIFKNNRRPGFSVFPAIADKPTPEEEEEYARRVAMVRDGWSEEERLTRSRYQVEAMVVSLPHCDSFDIQEYWIDD